MLWRGGCSSVIFESVKGSWYQKVWESLPSSYWLLKIEILPNLLVNICCFEPVKWPSLLIPLAPPTYQHWRVTVWQTGLQDPRLHPQLASLVPDPATLLVQHSESHSYRETNCIALWAFMVTWGPCKPFLHTLSSSSLLLPETFMFAIWKNFLKAKVRFFLKGIHEGSNSGLSCDSDPITLSCVTWAIDWISLNFNLLLYKVGWQYMSLWGL